MTRRESQPGIDKSKEFITKEERKAMKVPLSPEEVARVMENVQRFALSDLNFRVRLARKWGLTEAGARYCVEQAIHEWDEREDDNQSSNLSTRESTPASERMEPASDTSGEDVHQERAPAEGMEGSGLHVGGAYDRARAAYQGDQEE